MSFITNYRLYCSGNEAPMTYHLFSGLVALSSIVSRRIWIDYGYFKVYCNLYVVLVGPAGNRKTTAMSQARKLLQALGNIPLGAESVTKEKLVLDMKEHEMACDALSETFPDQRIFTPYTVMVTELTHFFGADAFGMVDFLTTIYDQDIYASRTKNRGQTILTGPYLNVLACTTDEGITNYMKTDVVGGGFSRRALYIYERDRAQRIAFPEITPEQKAAWNNAIAEAHRIQTLSGPMRWTVEARDFYKNWYDNLIIPKDPVLGSFYESKHIQLLKIAMLLSVSESSNLTLEKNHLEAGLGILQLSEDNLVKVFSGVGRNVLNATSNKVLDLIERNPPRKITINRQEYPNARFIWERELRGLLFNQVKTKEMDEILEHLLTTDKILKVPVEVQGGIRVFIVLKSTLL